MSRKTDNGDRNEELPAAGGENTNTAKDCAYAITGAAAGALGIILYVLAVTTPVAIYGLIGGIVCEIAACGLFRTQKKRRPVKWAKAPAAICYVLLGLGAAFMLGGIIWASLQQS